MDLDFDMKRNRAGSVMKKLYEYDTHVHISIYTFLLFTRSDGIRWLGAAWMDI